MAVSYKKLWKLLIDKDMKKKDLCVAAGISHASMAKLGKNENVTTDVLVKICTALTLVSSILSSSSSSVSQNSPKTPKPATNTASPSGFFDSWPHILKI